MRAILLSCAITLALPTLPVIAQSRAGNAQVVGRIIDAQTNAPVAGARVSVTPVFRGTRDPRFRPPASGTPGGALNTVTDADGRFVLDDVPLGEVRVAAHKPGFADPVAQPVMTRAGWETVVNFFLRQGGVLSGRILDQRGEPLSGIRVMVMRRILGRDDLAMGGPGSVSDRVGEFRLDGLAAGEYALTGSAQSGIPLRGIDAGGARMTWAPTYYPGTANQSEAQSLTLSQGETVTGLEFRMIAAPVFRVTGIAVDESGMPVADAVVSLERTRTSRQGFPARLAIDHTKSDGTFAIGGVIAGTYIVSAGLIPRPGSASAMVRLSPGQEVLVDGADVTGVKAIVAPPR